METELLLTQARLNRLVGETSSIEVFTMVLVLTIRFDLPLPFQHPLDQLVAVALLDQNQELDLLKQALTNLLPLFGPQTYRMQDLRLRNTSMFIKRVFVILLLFLTRLLLMGTFTMANHKCSTSFLRPAILIFL